MWGCIDAELYFREWQEIGDSYHREISSKRAYPWELPWCSGVSDVLVRSLYRGKPVACGLVGVTRPGHCDRYQEKWI